jgi:hypothetical protein
MYEGLALVDPDESITPDALAAELRRFYAGKPDAPEAISVVEEEVRLEWRGYVLVAGLSAAPHVAEESAWLVEQVAPAHPSRERIARCPSRFEISGDPDPDMLHFNDYLFVGEALARLGRVYRFDQASGEFLE